MKHGVAIDGGAHRGTWSLELASKFSKVIAFEPEPANFKSLYWNTRHLDNVHRIQKALGWVTEHKVKLAWRLDGKSDTTRINERGEPAIITSLDKENIKNVSFIKLDLEGFEYFALRGGEGLLRQQKPLVLIEEKDGLSEYYGVPTGEARSWLKHIGMIELAKFKIDVLLGWPN